MLKILGLGVAILFSCNSVAESAVCDAIPESEIQSTKSEIQSTNKKQGLYIFQKGHFNNKLFYVDQDSDIAKIADYSDDEKFFEEYKSKTISINGGNPYCLIVFYKSEGVSLDNYEYGIFFNSHYKLFGSVSNSSVDFLNFGNQKFVNISSDQYKRLFSGKSISQDKSIKLYNEVLFDIKGVNGNNIGPVNDLSTFKKLFEIPKIFSDESYQHAFEFSRFFEPQDKVLRVIKKSYEARPKGATASHQVTFVRLLSSTKERIVGPAYWVVAFDFGEKVVE